MTLTRELFYSQVTKTETCWVWTGPLSGGRNEYGKTHGKYAHRAAWEFEVGPIPAGFYVLHHCDNPPCVRREHLFLGTQFDNMRDAAAKGRVASHNGGKGSNHYAAKVTPEIARAIQRGASAGVAKAAIARHFGIGSSTVGRVIAGQHWTAAA